MSVRVEFHGRLRTLAASGIAGQGLLARGLVASGLSAFVIVLSGCAVQPRLQSQSLPAKPALYPQAINVVPGQPDISGIWVVKEFVFSARPSEDRKTRTIDGQEAPLQSWAAALYQKRANEADEGNSFADTASRCLPNGMPLMMYDAPYPMQIIQQPGQVTMLFEEETTFRIIYLDEKPPADPDPTYAGKSVGHFEGDTLVVQTVGLNADTTIDKLGLPHTEMLRVTERIRRLKPDLLEDLITLDDPGAYTRPWTLRHTYRLWPVEKKMLEYVCNENQRNSPSDASHSGFGQ